MKNKEIFLSAIASILYSGPADAPESIIESVNELLDWYEMEYDVTLGIRFEEDNYEEVFETIINS